MFQYSGLGFDLPKPGHNFDRQNIKMRKLILPFMVLVVVVVLVIAAMGGTEPAMTAKDTVFYSPAPVEFRMNMRKLWEDHIAWTRNYIISALANLEDIDQITQRLLKNQDDIGNAFTPVYGNATAAKLSALLREHILLATEVVTAAKTGNNSDLANAQAKWTANAGEIATFLVNTNSNWSKKDCAMMLARHLELTTDELDCRIKKDWAGDINAYDKGHEHILMFADMLAEGMVKQYPDKFTAGISNTQVVVHTITDAEIGKKVMCPVMKVPVKVGKSTPALEYKGKVYYFCCNQCPVEFKNNPEKYAGER